MTPPDDTPTAATEGPGAAAAPRPAPAQPARPGLESSIEILARDRAPGISEESQIEKTLRVVSTVEYMLN